MVQAHVKKVLAVSAAGAMVSTSVDQVLRHLGRELRSETTLRFQTEPPTSRSWALAHLRSEETTRVQLLGVPAQDAGHMSRLLLPTASLAFGGSTTPTAAAAGFGLQKLGIQDLHFAFVTRGLVNEMSARLAAELHLGVIGWLLRANETLAGRVAAEIVFIADGQIHGALGAASGIISGLKSGVGEPRLVELPARDDVLLEGVSALLDGLASAPV